VHDESAVTLQLVEDQSGEVDGGTKVDVDHAGQRLCGLAHHRSAEVGASIVDEAIDAAKMRHRLADNESRGL
jgi:hypothetical protein